MKGFRHSISAVKYTILLVLYNPTHFVMDRLHYRKLDY